MSFRNLSPQKMFFEMAKAHRPKYKFGINGNNNFAEWKEKAYPEVIDCLGDFPGRMPLNGELMAEWEHDALFKQRWLIDVGPHISATLLVNYPQKPGATDKFPAILCCHGHGAFGKEPVMGNDSTPEMKQCMDACNYSYGHQMAKEGYVTFAIDWIGFGERNDSRKPHFSSVAGNRDWCNILYLHATMLGMTSISINVSHGKAAVDFVGALDCVDENKIGVMGLSGGGTMTLWMSLCDERIKASEIMCYSDLWTYFGIRDVNYCGMQVAPGLFKLMDLPDVQGLIAPNPLLVDIGAYDDCFKVDNAMACFKQVKAIYDAAGVPDRLELDLHPGPHAWGANKSKEFFGKYL